MFLIVKVKNIINVHVFLIFIIVKKIMIAHVIKMFLIVKVNNSMIAHAI